MMPEQKTVPISAIVTGGNYAGRSTQDIESLATSISAVGLLQPPLVRVHPTQKGKYELIAGERRLNACKQLKWVEVPVFIAEVSDKVLEQQRAAENVARVNLELWQEVEAVVRLQAADMELTPKHIADVLGVTPHWVAVRIRLNQIPEKIRAKVKHWSAAAILQLATCSPESLELMAKNEAWIFNDKIGPQAENLKHQIRNYNHQLSAARWKLDAEPKPCTTCPDNSANTQFLFPDAKPTDAICMNHACWESKKNAVVQIQLDKVKEQTGSEPIKLSTNYNAKDATYIWNANKCKKTDKGAKPAVVIDGPDAGKIEFITDKRPSNKSNKDDTPAKPATEKERYDAFQLRRRAKSIDKVINRIEQIKAMAVPDLWKFVVAFGTNTKHNCKGATNLPKTFALSRLQLLNEIWEQVTPIIKDRWKVDTVSRDVPKIWPEVEFIAGELSIDLKAIERETADEMPLPATLQGYVARAAKLKTKPAKKTDKAKRPADRKLAAAGGV